MLRLSSLLGGQEEAKTGALARQRAEHLIGYKHEEMGGLRLYSSNLHSLERGLSLAQLAVIERDKSILQALSSGPIADKQVTVKTVTQTINKE